MLGALSLFRPRAGKNSVAGIRVSPLPVEAAQATIPAVMEKLQTSPRGLSREQAEQRLEEQGPNTVVMGKRFRRLRLLGHALANPLVILLAILATISFATGDMKAVCGLVWEWAMRELLKKLHWRRLGYRGVGGSFSASLGW